MSPISTWLKRSPDHGMHAVAEDDRIVVTLMDEHGLAGMGEGDTVEIAEAAALNDIMRRSNPTEEK